MTVPTKTTPKTNHRNRLNMTTRLKTPGSVRTTLVTLLVVAATFLTSSIAAAQESTKTDKDRLLDDCRAEVERLVEVCEATADEDNTCLVSVKKIEADRDKCAGKLEKSEKAEHDAKVEARKLRLENATLKASRPPRGVPTWLRVAAGYVGGGTAVAGGACLAVDSCPQSTGIVLLVGSTALTVFAVLLPDRWFREGREPRS